MAEQGILHLPELALLVSERSLEVLKRSPKPHRHEYALTSILEEEESSWHKNFGVELEFADGAILLLRKNEKPGHLDSETSKSYEAALYHDGALSTQVYHTTRNYFKVLEASPGNYITLHRRLLAAELTGLVCQKCSPEKEREILTGAGTIAYLIGRCLPEDARPVDVVIHTQTAQEMKPIARVDRAKAGIFSVEYVY